MTQDFDFLSCPWQFRVQSNHRRGIFFRSVSKLFWEAHWMKMLKYGNAEKLKLSEKRSFSFFKLRLRISAFQLFSV